MLKIWITRIFDKNNNHSYELNYMENSTLIRAYIDNKYNKKTQLLNNVECNDLASVSTNFEEFEYLNFNCDNSGKVFSVNKIKKIVNKHLK